jgi:hypothetical protein
MLQTGRDRATAGGVPRQPEEPYPQPMAWQQAATHLNDLQPDAGWTDRNVARLVEKIRTRLSKDCVAGLICEEVGEPVGNR